MALIVALLGVLGVARFVEWNAPPTNVLRTGMVHERVTVEPQPVLTGTMDGDCYLSKIEAGGHRWREEHNRYRAAPVAGRLVVTEVGTRWATAEFESVHGEESGTFVATWDGGHYPSSDPCGY